MQSVAAALIVIGLVLGNSAQAATGLWSCVAVVPAEAGTPAYEARFALRLSPAGFVAEGESRTLDGVPGRLPFRAAGHWQGRGGSLRLDGTSTAAGIRAPFQLTADLDGGAAASTAAVSPAFAQRATCRR